MTALLARITKSAALGRLPVALLLCVLAVAPGAVRAQDAEAGSAPAPEAGWKVEDVYVFTSLYTKHFDPDPDHVNNQKMLGVELIMENRWSAGFATFDNSFGQQSEFLYAGYRWPIRDSRHWYFKLTGGLLHGYKDEYEDKIPFNGLGIAPAIVPTLGFRYKGLVVEGNLGGLAVFTLTAGWAF